MPFGRPTHPLGPPGSPPTPDRLPPSPGTLTRVNQPPPPPIPYVDVHAGEKRHLLIRFEPPLSGRAGAYVVGVDGRPYVVTWAAVVFEIPADRPVHVSVHVTGEEAPYAASLLLFPASRAELTYRLAPLSGATLT